MRPYTLICMIFLSFALVAFISPPAYAWSWEDIDDDHYDPGPSFQGGETIGDRKFPSYEEWSNAERNFGGDTSYDNYQGAVRNAFKRYDNGQHDWWNYDNFPYRRESHNRDDNDHGRDYGDNGHDDGYPHHSHTGNNDDDNRDYHHYHHRDTADNGYRRGDMSGRTHHHSPGDTGFHHGRYWWDHTGNVGNKGKYRLSGPRVRYDAVHKRLSIRTPQDYRGTMKFRFNRHSFTMRSFHNPRAHMHVQRHRQWHPRGRRHR